MVQQLRHSSGSSGSSAKPKPKPEPPASGIAALTSRQLLLVSGSDAPKFLQGIVTANMMAPDGLPRTDAFYAGFLNATGRVIHDVFIYPFRSGSGLAAQEEHGYLVEADAAHIARLAKQIRRYKLRARVTVRSLAPDEASVWHAWHDASSAPRPPLAPASGKTAIVLKDPRAPGLGHRIIRLGGADAPEIDVETTSEDAYTVRRYLHGVPEGPGEILPELALPLESNMDLMNGIDFHKGCYVGQELTVRTRHRGVVRKRMLPCVIYETSKAPPQALVYDAECGPPDELTSDMIPAETSIGRFGKKGRSVGKWLKGVGNIGLGLCRLEMMTDVVLPGEQAAATYKPGDEFVLEWGEGEDDKSSVKVRAFVPEWLRQGLTP
ncbi:hypothetical protein UVI_02046870 [Ustilaginoidea virens]|uniref:Iron-sulfur cluster assembly factor IBA57 homolog, mitochondrial n=1 Tax=Ustilaginoidea virens TaxID=1159556 RepID=A0A1B5L4P4_USTVR|nr:hypothetical protein UVI_02046870 [Ustilaginoidea virens]